MLLLLGSLPLLLMTGYYLIFSTKLSIDGILAILQSNIQESLEFITVYFKLEVLNLGAVKIILILLSIRSVYNRIYLDGIPPPVKQKFAVLLLIILLLSNISFAGKTYLARAFQDALKQMEQIKKFTADSKLREEKLNVDKYLFSEVANLNFALIIGETHARSNMSVYGYSKETTPWLNKAAADKKMILLQNWFSNAAVTTHSLEYALTAKNQYSDIYEELKPEPGSKDSIMEDVIFEAELVKQIEVNIDYILMLVAKYHDGNCEDKEILVAIQKAIKSSLQLRSKKELIENFIATVNTSTDVNSDWQQFVKEQRENDIQTLIKEEKLKPEETRKFVDNAFRDGVLKTTGTDVDRLMPPVSRFGGGNRTAKKTGIINKLKAFFEKYFGLGIANDETIE